MTALRLDEPFRWGGDPQSKAVTVIPRDGMAMVAKAATGLDRFYGPGTYPLSAFNRTPQKLMREAQAMYYANPWIRRAESTVTAKVAGLPWHVEDENDDEVDDETPNPALKQVRDLLEKPQMNLPPEDRQPGLSTRRGLVSVTSRHMGLTNFGYWFLDGVDGQGIPLAIMSIEPWRLTVDSTPKGNLIGYRLDADDYGYGGTPLRPSEVLAFYLDIPDSQVPATGLVGSAALKARLSTAGDLHVLSVLGTGGRIAGLVSPKQGYIDSDEQFEQLVRDWRNVNESPDAAKRATISRGAVDFTQLAADPQDLGLNEIASASRDDIFAAWGVPPSQAGVPQSRGLNSGDSAKHEYEVLMTGPVHDRVISIQETVQFDLLDRYHVLGIMPELVIEEPTFDDDGPAYEIAAKALNLPLTNNERRELVGLDPLPEYGPTGEPLGVGIWLPMSITETAQGPEEKGTEGNWFPNAPKPKPTPTPPTNLGILPPAPQAQLGAGAPPAPAVAKAGGFLGLRATVDKRTIPQVRKALERFLEEQRSDIANRIRKASPRQLKDESFWFSETWDKALAKVLKPYMAGIAQTVTTRTADLLAPGKAKKPTAAAVATAVEETPDAFVQEVERFVLTRTGLRIGGINSTTRDAVANVIRAGITESLTASEIADRIEQMSAFDEARAELVARTETGFAYNSAAISSYQQYGVDQVEAIDGDYDEVCADRNGRIFSVEEAADIEDHPNGTLDWAPVVAKADDPALILAKAVQTLAEKEAPQPIFRFSMPAPKPSEVHITMAEQPAPVVNLTVPPPLPTTRTILRDEQGRITGLEEV